MLKLRDRARAAGLTLAGAAGRVARSLPGLAATGCAVTGVAILWGAGWAFLAAVPFLLAMDRSTQ